MRIEGWKKFEDLANALRDKILDGEWKPGDFLPNRDELEEAYGVSVATLQRAINILIHEGFLVASRGIGTQVAPNPPHLSRYGVVVPRPTGGYGSLFWMALEASVMSFTNTPECTLELYRKALEGVSWEDSKLLSDVSLHRIGGIIMCGNPRGILTSPLVVQGRIPVVTWSSQAHPPGLPAAFYVDYTAFLEKAVQFLAGKHRKNVALIGTTGMLAPDREAAFDQAAAAAGLYCPPEWRQSVFAGRPETVGNMVRLLFSRHQSVKPDGLIVMDDNLAEEVGIGLRTEGMETEDDLLVVSHANYPNPGTDVFPMTRLGFHIETFMAQAVGYLKAMQRGETVPELTLLPPVFEEALG